MFLPKDTALMFHYFVFFCQTKTETDSFVFQRGVKTLT